MKLDRATHLAWNLYEQEGARAAAAYAEHERYLAEIRPCATCGGHNPDHGNHTRCYDCRDTRPRLVERVRILAGLCAVCETPLCPDDNGICGACSARIETPANACDLCRRPLAPHLGAICDDCAETWERTEQELDA